MNKTTVQLHPRCAHRAIDRCIERRASAAIAFAADGGAPTPALAIFQYIKRWARWWRSAHPHIQYDDIYVMLITKMKKVDPSLISDELKSWVKKMGIPAID